MPWSVWQTRHVSVIRKVGPERVQGDQHSRWSPPAGGKQPRAVPRDAIEGIRAPARVVVPLDGSSLAERALGLAQTLAIMLTASIELVHVVDLTSPLAVRRDAGERYLTEVATRFPPDMPVDTQVLEGKPVDELLRRLDGAHHTIVAMSTHGRSGIQRFLFGSVADKVIRGAAVPVAVVRDVTEHVPNIRTIMVPLDGSCLAGSALPVALNLAHDQRTIRLVRVVDTSHPRDTMAISYTPFWSDPTLLADVMSQTEDEARGALEKTTLRLRGAGYQVSWEVRAGRPSDEIIRDAETTGTDLVVMATHGVGDYAAGPSAV